MKNYMDIPNEHSFETDDFISDSFISSDDPLPLESSDSEIEEVVSKVL